MRTSERLRTLCEKYRNVAGKNQKQEKKRIKTKLIPAFAPCALLFEGKGHSNVIGLTNLCYMDIDDLNEAQMNEAFAILSKDEHVVLVARSMSNNGLHFLVKYGFKDMEQPQITTMTASNMVKTYIPVFNTISQLYQNLLQLKIVDSGKNVVQTCNISYDEHLYYNPDACPYILVYEELNNNSHQQFQIV